MGNETDTEIESVSPRLRLEPKIETENGGVGVSTPFIYPLEA